jgi:hypothetical protein
VLIFFRIVTRHTESIPPERPTRILSFPDSMECFDMLSFIFAINDFFIAIFYHTLAPPLQLLLGVDII